MKLRSLLPALAILASIACPGSAQEWPQFLGPNRNGVTTVSNLATSWPKDGPAVLWRHDVGEGFSGPVIAGGRLVICHRVADVDEVLCLDPATGKALWKGGLPATYRDDFGMEEGPRATPAMADGRVFTFSADGLAAAWNVTNGAVLWKVDTRKEYGARKGFFGLAASPLVENGLVILNVGGRDGAGFVALDAASGQLRWKATGDEASYASPVAATVAGQRRVFALTREAFVGIDPADGRLLFRHPWRPAMHASVSAATPLVLGDQLFLSASYDTGATLLRVGDGKPEVVWESKDALASHYSTCVEHGGYLYGFDGRADPALQRASRFRCVDLKTGQVRWTESSLKSGTVTRVNDRLLILTEQGELLLAAATPERFQVAARAQVLSLGVRAHPAVAQGKLFARGKDRLVAVRLTEGQ